MLLCAAAGTLPPSPPAATGDIAQNAFGSITFASPMGTAVPEGETHRLFVFERGGTVQVLTNLSGAPVKSAYLSLTSILGAGETLRTDGENGFLSMAFHPDFASNGFLFVYYNVRVSNQDHQRLHRIRVSIPAANAAGIVAADTTRCSPSMTARRITTAATFASAPGSA